VAVTTETPKKETLHRRIEQPGDVHAYEQTPMYARISGLVNKVYKDIGDEVKEGEVLADLSVPEMDEELKQKTALVEHAATEEDTRSARAKVAETRANELRAAAELRRASSQLERLEKTRGVVTEELLEETRLGKESAQAVAAEAEAKRKSAESAVAAALARAAKAEADIRVAEARLKVAQANEKRQAALVAYKELKAPFKGIVTRRKIDPGHFLQPGPGGNMEAAFVVASIDPVRVWIDIPETDAVLIQAGKTPVTFSVQALGGEEFKGTVTRLSWALDARVRTLRAEVELKNPARKLRPGMYISAVLHAEKPNALTLPASAILSEGDDHFCFLFDRGKAIRTPIKVGLRQGERVEVISRRAPGKDGDWLPFTVNDEVITGPLGRLTNGQAVKKKSAR
jgi:RND family efflux transporter MFP subunit